jgi:hypothetical protein
MGIGYCVADDSRYLKTPVIKPQYALILQQPQITLLLMDCQFPTPTFQSSPFVRHMCKLEILDFKLSSK